MPRTTKQLDFIRRKENVDEIDNAIKLIEIQIKDSIIKQGLSNSSNEKKQFENQINLYTRLLSGLIIVWSEAMIKWLCYEHGAFEDAQIMKLVHEKKSLEQKWTCAITAAFYKAFSGIPYSAANVLPSKSDITSASSIPQQDKNTFINLYNLVDTKIVPAIGIRNKIQHGDWVNAFKTDGNTGLTSYDNSLSAKIEEDNLLVLKIKKKQIKGIYNIIRDLATFKKHGQFKLDAGTTPFLHFFGKRYQHIMENQKAIDTADFQKYKEMLVKNELNGQEQRKKLNERQL